MDVLNSLAVLFGVINVIWAGEKRSKQKPRSSQGSQWYDGSDSLKCIECTHIYPHRNPPPQTASLQNVITLLDNKFNLGCDLEDPFSMEELAWREQELRDMNGYVPPGWVNNVGQVPCHSPMSPTTENRCNFIRGILGIELPDYNNERLHMNMTIRSCEMVDRLLENVCYERNGALGNQDLLNYFQNKLTFLGRVNVVSFYGRQCYCARSLCKPLINGSERTSGYVTGLILAAILTLFL